MIDLFATAFKYEIAQVFEQGSIGPRYTYSLSIIANGKEIPTTAVVGIHRLRDYINNYTDLLSLTFITSQDDLEYKIKPYQDNLEAIVTRRLVSSNPSIQQPSQMQRRVVAKYKAVMADSSRDIIEQNNPFIKDRDVLRRSMSKPVTIQLIDPTVDKLRLLTVGTIPRDEYGMKVIETILTKFSKEATNLVGTSTLGLDIAPGYNDEVRKAIVIPDFTPVTSVPNLIAAESGGIYPSGFSYYLQDRIWYLYPPYNPKRFFSVKRNLTIVNVPKNRLAGLEKTYRNSNTQMIILCTGEVSHVDFSDQNQLNYGNGSRFLDAKRLTKMGTMKNNRYMVDATKNLNEFQTTERNDGLSVAFQGTNPITTNKNAQASLIAARMGSFVQLEWYNGDDSLIYPGMPIRYLYLADTKPTEAFGVVAAIETYQAPESDNIANPKLASKSAITVFIHHPK